MSDQRLSELYRIAAKEHVELEAAANLLEETKSANLSQMMQSYGDIPVSKAEMKAKASSQWMEFLWKMTGARKAANLKKVEVEWIRMRFQGADIRGSQQPIRA